MENKIKLLLISFYFPPSNLVGARRWAKHLKYAHKDGLNFDVLTRSFPFNNASWLKDIAEYNDRVVRLKFDPRYTYYKSCLPKSISDKIRWKFSYWASRFVKPFENEILGDDSIGAEKIFLQHAEKIIAQKGITHVLLTVGPHRFSTILPELKKKYPALKMIIDYRDYWHDKEHKVDSQLLAKEKEIEDQVLNSVDGILVVNKEMEAYFRKRTGNQKAVMTLPHCYDPDDIPAPSSVNKKNEYANNLKFIYGGALYAGMENHVSSLVRFATALQEKGFSTETKLFVPFTAYNDILKGLGTSLDVNGTISSEEYFRQVVGADFVLYFRPDWSPNAFSSKFFELLALRKPILYFGPKSDVSEFLESNNLGMHFPDNFDANTLERFLTMLKNLLRINQDYDLDIHSFGKVNQQLYTFLSEGILKADQQEVATEHIQRKNA